MIQKKTSQQKTSEMYSEKSLEQWRNDGAKYYNFLLSEIISQYRIFSNLRPLLEHPREFSTRNASCLIPLVPSVRKEMIEMYYNFDEAVIREFLGKKISSKAIIKDLDLVSEKTNVSMSSVRRQVRNFNFIQFAFTFSYQILNM